MVGFGLGERLYHRQRAEVGAMKPVPGEHVVDGHGLALAPGFIDPHYHSTEGLLWAMPRFGAKSWATTTDAAQGMRDGAFALSSGLEYEVGGYSDSEEVTQAD